MKKLPIGISSFEEIRTGGYYYVDKTYFVKKLVEEGKYYFLSRPRRFGKSLFVDTLKSAFEGKKELFEGLYLENNWNWQEKYPVVRISFVKDTLSVDDLKNRVRSIIKEKAREEEVEIEERESIGTMLENLVKGLYRKNRRKVVLLVDEYDKAIIDNIEDREKAERIRKELKEFYSVLKDLDQYLHFVFITGISKFAKVSLFSGLNQLNDISLNKEYGDICGYTEEELIQVFGELIKGEEELEKIREWYNGYCWLGPRIYNPFDVLLYMENRVYRSYWFKTGNPEFLVKVIREKGYYIPNLEEVVVDDNVLDMFDIEEIRIEALLFQTGYLTIKEMIEEEDWLEYRLCYPNKEVKVALNSYIGDSIWSEKSWIREVRKIFVEGKLLELENVLNQVYGSVPNIWYRDVGRYDSFYCALFYVLLVSSGLEVIAEDVTSIGRIDLTVISKGKVYIIELKVDKEGAIKQIKEKRYYEKYLDREEIYLVGIVIDSKERKVKKMDIERYR